tara:strand:+ start:2394 stop:4772 length:2379 start_codon:yes stop_codon:yes gene_type:complete
MKAKLNILEAYLDRVLQEAGTKGKHNRWFYGADQGSIDTLASMARSPLPGMTPEMAKAKTEAGPAWRAYATDEGDGMGGEHTVYWHSLSGPQSAKASALLAAIATWKPEDTPSEDQFSKELEAAPGQEQFDAEQEAEALEQQKQQEAEANDRKSNPEQVERIAKNLEQLGIEFTSEKMKLGSVEEVTMTAEEVAEAIDKACMVPPSNSYLHDLLEVTRGKEHRYGFEGAANQEVLDVFDEILQAVPHIQKDDEGSYVLDEDLTERQKEILDTVRCRNKGLFVGFNRNGETSLALPQLNTAMTDVVASREEAGKSISRDFDTYGVSNKHTKHICNALAGVKRRDGEGNESPLLKSSGDGGQRGENNLIGTFTEKAYVGIIQFMNGKYGDGSGENDSMEEGIQEMASVLQKLDSAVRASESSFDGVIPSLLTDEETEMCDWYRRAETAFNIHGEPNDLVKALFMQRAMELKAIVETGGVAPVNAREPSKEEERGHDKVLGVKRDIVFEFASAKDAQKFAKNIGLGKEYAHDKEVDLSLKTLDSMNKSINFEGCTLDVAMDNSPLPYKQKEYQDNFQNRTEYITRTNKAVGKNVAENMTKAKEWDRDMWGKIQSALSENNDKIMPALTSIISKASDNTSVAASIQTQEHLAKFEKMVKEMNASTGGERKALATYVGRNMLSLLKYERAQKDKKYAQGSALHDVINTLASRESEAVLRVANGKISVFAGDQLMDDAISAVVDGRAVAQPLGGFHFRDAKGNKMFNTSYVVSRQGFVRVRGTVQGRYFNEYSQVIQA